MPYTQQDHKRNTEITTKQASTINRILSAGATKQGMVNWSQVNGFYKKLGLTVGDNFLSLFIKVPQSNVHPVTLSIPSFLTSNIQYNSEQQLLIANIINDLNLAGVCGIKIKEPINAKMNGGEESLEDCVTIYFQQDMSIEEIILTTAQIEHYLKTAASFDETDLLYKSESKSKSSDNNPKPAFSLGTYCEINGVNSVDVNIFQTSLEKTQEFSERLHSVGMILNQVDEYITARAQDEREYKKPLLGSIFHYIFQYSRTEKLQAANAFKEMVKKVALGKCTYEEGLAEIETYQGPLQQGELGRYFRECQTELRQLSEQAESSNITPSTI